MAFQKDDLELLRIVGEDLLHISDEAIKPPTLAIVRRLSPLLRRLLNDDDLIRSWKVLSLAPPKQPAIATQKIFGNVPNNTTIWAGATSDGTMTMYAASITIGGKASGDYHVDDVVLPLHEFLDSTAVVFKGTRIKRQQLISYIANKRGGAHLDRKRKKDEEAYSLLDELEDFQLGASFLPTASHQLLGIAQALVKSDDIQRLLKACLAVSAT